MIEGLSLLDISEILLASEYSSGLIGVNFILSRTDEVPDKGDSGWLWDILHNFSIKSLLNNKSRFNNKSRKNIDFLIMFLIMS